MQKLKVEFYIRKQAFSYICTKQTSEKKAGQVIQPLMKYNWNSYANCKSIFISIQCEYKNYPQTI